MAISLMAMPSFSALVDTSGAPVTNETALGDIDMAASKMGDLADYMTNSVAGIDTSYVRYTRITNKNQSVQYVCTDANTTELEILMPDSGDTKDWIVYILATTNLNLILPAATYWTASETATNAIPPDTPTAMYFSQIDADTYTLGRTELVPVTILSQKGRALKRAKGNASAGTPKE